MLDFTPTSEHCWDSASGEVLKGLIQILYGFSVQWKARAGEDFS